MATIFGIFIGVWIICHLLQDKTERKYSQLSLKEEDDLYNIQPIYEDSKE